MAPTTDQKMLVHGGNPWLIDPEALKALAATAKALCAPGKGFLARCEFNTSSAFQHFCFCSLRAPFASFLAPLVAVTRVPGPGSALVMLSAPRLRILRLSVLPTVPCCIARLA